MVPSDSYIPGFLRPPCMYVCAYVYMHLCACMPVYYVQACVGGGVLSECLHVSTCVYICVYRHVLWGFLSCIYLFGYVDLNCGTWDLLL